MAATLACSNDLAERLRRTQMDFLEIDLALGRTFSTTALQADDAEKRARNQRAARKAFDTVLRFMGKVAATDGDAKRLKEDLSRLKRDLTALGEVF